MWLIATFPGLGLDIDDYTAVKKHLLSFGRQRLEQSGKRLSGGQRSRKKTGNAWFETQDTCAYHAEFQKEKLFWIELSDEGRFSYDDGSMFAVNTVYMLTGSAVKFLCAVLNSRLITWYVNNTAVTSGMGATRWFSYVVEAIPVPEAPEPARIALEQVTESVLKAMNTQSDYDAHNREKIVDQIVYELYGLTEKEIRVVER